MSTAPGASAQAETLATYASLCEEHRPAALRVAAALDAEEPSDVVEQACAAMLPAVLAGEVAEVGFRPYLLGAVRRLAEPGAGSAVTRVFDALPGVSQAVLWHGDVEGRSDTEVARLLGITPDAVGEVGDDARTARRRGLVPAHAGDARGPSCHTARTALPAYVRAALPNAEATRVAAHLDCCRGCTTLYLELVEAETDLRGLLAPAVLGGAAAAYLAGLPAPLPERGRAASSVGAVVALATGRPARLVAAGLVACGLVLGAVGLLGTDGGRSEPETYAAPVVASDGPRPIRSSPRATPSPDTQPSSGAPAAQVTQTTQPTQTPPASQPTGQPTSQPTSQPTQTPSAPTTPVVSVAPVVPVAVPVAPEPVTVAATASRSGLGPTSVVTVDVTGLAARTGVVTITADQLLASLQLDSRCSLVGLSSATCVLPGDGTVSLVALSLPLTPTTLTITAAPEGQAVDPSATGSTTSITLGGRV